MAGSFEGDAQQRGGGISSGGLDWLYGGGSGVKDNGNGCVITLPTHDVCEMLWVVDWEAGMICCGVTNAATKSKGERKKNRERVEEGRDGRPRERREGKRKNVRSSTIGMTGVLMDVGG